MRQYHPNWEHFLRIAPAGNEVNVDLVVIKRIFKHRSLVVDIIDHIIQVSVIIKVCIGGAV